MTIQKSAYIPGTSYPEASSPSAIRKCLILIPDISGYSDFVAHTDIEIGQSIIYRLLSAIIETNTLELQVSEIEGDAVLFYRYGPAPSVSTILKQFEQMHYKFNAVLSQLESDHPTLSLKMIAHYGPVTEFKIGGFVKLYGEPLIVAHRLLKNTIQSQSYVLITDELKNAGTFQSEPLHVLAESSIYESKLCEVYGNLRKVCFSYFDYET